MRVPYAPIAMALLIAAACSPGEGSSALPEDGELVEPPFEVSGDAEGLMLVWFDEEGLHTAARRDEIPEGRRERVRVDSLDLPPEDRLDPELVYVADLREPQDDGRYSVRTMSRARFDQLVEQASTAEVRVAEAPSGDEAADPDADVVIYGASWCSACRGAAAYLRQREIPFVERDVEREPGARQAMLEAARAAGVRPSGIPVIDFRGEIIAGFDRAALDRAIERSRRPI